MNVDSEKNLFSQRLDNDLLFLIKKYAETLIEQTKSKRQEIIELKLNKQMRNFKIFQQIFLRKRFDYYHYYFLQQRTMFLTKLMKTMLFQFQHQVFRTPKLMMKLLTNKKINRA